MSWIVTIRPRARTDLQQAHNWYEARCSGLGIDFLAAHAEALLRLETDPCRFPLYYRDFRRVLTRRFPYKIFYRIVGSNVIIYRILHGAQNHPDMLLR